MTDKELLQQALDALNEFDSGKRNHGMTWQVPLIKTIKARLAQPENEFNPDWDRIAPLEEALREHMTEIQRLRALLAQPEPAECDGGQCGIGGYCKECPKPLVKLKEMLEIQGRDGTWNYDHYFHGMYNGMEVMLAVLEGRDSVFREAPKKWLSKKEWVGLTDDEYESMAEQYVTNCYFDTLEYAKAIETKLKEKNT